MLYGMDESGALLGRFSNNFSISNEQSTAEVGNVMMLLWDVVKPFSIFEIRIYFV